MELVVIYAVFTFANFMGMSALTQTPPITILENQSVSMRKASTTRPSRKCVSNCALFEGKYLAEQAVPGH